MVAGAAACGALCKGLTSIKTSSSAPCRAGGTARVEASSKKLSLLTYSFRRPQVEFEPQARLAVGGRGPCSREPHCMPPALRQSLPHGHPAVVSASVHRRPD